MKSEMLITGLMVLNVIVAVLLILAVVLQPGKGNGMGSMFGGGENAVAGRGQSLESLLEKATMWLALIFGILSLILAKLALKGSL